MFATHKASAGPVLNRLFFRPAGDLHLRRMQGLPAALILSLLLMLVGLADVLQRVLAMGGGSRVGGAILLEAVNSPVLRWQIAGFVGSHLLLHSLLGFSLWILARSTVRAFPQSRIRLFWIILGWWLLASVTIYIANATLFPDSLAGPPLEFVRTDLGSRLSLYHVLSVLVATSIAVVLVRSAMISSRRRMVGRLGVYGTLALAGVGIIGSLPELQAEQHHTADPAKPNVILIGIDSLRPDMVGIDNDAWYTPRINAFLRESHVFPDAVTPLARTFASWMTILSGRHPTSTHARDNLVPFDRLDIRRLLPQRFREQGYRTVYATDDVRFSNIDEKYDFDKIIGPPMGASDFILGNFNDVPLANLIANTSVARWLFPNTYANRAAEVTYRPATFDSLLEDELSFETPTFLSVHLTLPHFPYTWAHDSGDAFAGSPDNPYPYLAAVSKADEQFDALMRLLERRGALNNAIVVLLSDHGEGLGLPADNLIATREAKAAAERTMVWVWGHGTSVLSPQQYSVVLAFRRFDARQYVAKGAKHADTPASLEDVAPTVLQLAGIEHAPSDFDGVSLAAAMGEHPGSLAEVRDRVRFTETGISVALLKQGQPQDKQELLAQGAFYFNVDRASGRVQLRTDQWDFLIRGKERAAVVGEWLLAAIPVDGGKTHRYLLVNRRGGVPRIFHGKPETAEDPIAAKLWEALQIRFPGELTAGVH